MGQKIHPTGFRLAVTRNWSSRWYANNRDFAGMLAEDIKVREYLTKKLKNASVARILIERPAKSARITIFSARPGVVIGKKGEDIENLKKELNAIGNNFNQAVHKLHLLDKIPEFRIWVHQYDGLQKMLVSKVEEIKLRMNQLYEQWLQK